MVWFYIFFFNTTDIRDQENNIFNLFLSVSEYSYISVVVCFFLRAELTKRKENRSKAGCSYLGKTKLLNQTERSAIL